MATGSDYEMYRPAYRFGVDTYVRYPDGDFNLIEPSLGADWYNWRGNSKLDWHVAKTGDT